MEKIKMEMKYLKNKNLMMIKIKMMKKTLMMIKIKMDKIKINNNKINHHNLKKEDDILIFILVLFSH